MREWGWQRPIPMGSQGAGSQTSTTQVVLPDFINDAAKAELANAQTLAARPYEANPNQTVAPLTADQTAAYDTVRGMQGATAGDYAASKTALAGLLGGATPITAAGLAGDATSLMNPYTDAVVDPAVALMRQQLGVTKQGIAANAANVGAFGGSRMGVQEGVADSQEALQAGQLKGGLLQSGWNTALSTASGLNQANLTAALQAAGLLPQVSSAGQAQTAKDAALLEGVGRAEQGQTQQEINNQAQLWQEQFDWPMTGQTILQSALAATPYGQTTTSSQPLTKNTAGGLLGGAASGAAIGTAISPGIGTGIGAIGGALLGAFA